MSEHTGKKFFRPLEGPAWLRPVAFLGRMVQFQASTAVTATCVAIVLSVTEGLGLGLLLPLLAIIGVGPGTAKPSGPARAIEGAFAALHVPLSLTGVLGVFFTVGLLQIFLTALQQHLVEESGEHATLKLRQLLFDAASRAQWTVLAAGRGGYLINAIVSESNRVGLVFGNCITVFGLIVSFCVYLALAAWLSWKFTLVTIGVGLASLIGLRSLYRSSQRFGAYTSAASNRLQELLNEHIAAAKLIRAYGADRWSRRTFGKAATNVSHYIRRNHLNSIMVKASVEPFGLLVIVGMVYLSVAVVHLPIANLMLLLLIFYRITPRLVQLQEMLQRIHSILPNYDAVSSALLKLDLASERQGGRPFAGLHDGIELNGVSVSHAGRTVIDRLALRIPAKTTIALIGTSGGGKTTLLDTLTGVLQPDEGQVLIDGVPLDEIELASYRSRISIVSQDSVLFHDTIAANLRFSAPDATDQELWEALRAAHADQFVKGSPNGLDTLAGDSGLRMSGGQRQRLSLARALLRKPEILLLDEPSSALDAETEAVLRQTFKDLRGKMTIVLVSHRPALAEDADFVYHVSGGGAELVPASSVRS